MHRKKGMQVPQKLFADSCAAALLDLARMRCEHEIREERRAHRRDN
jgi:hypothetical protein